jgi:hypothetical protein
LRTASGGLQPGFPPFDVSLAGLYGNAATVIEEQRSISTWTEVQATARLNAQQLDGK